MGWVANAMPWLLYPKEWRSIHCIGGWVALRASLDGCRKSHPYRVSIPGPSSLQQVTIPTTLSQPTLVQVCLHKLCHITLNYITAKFHVVFTVHLVKQLKVLLDQHMHYILITKSINPTYVSAYNRPSSGGQSFLQTLHLLFNATSRAVHNAQLVQHNTGKLQHPCDNSIQDRTATNLYITANM
jgi:hypothetical protein